ncbi:competence/damage-inducible protein A [Sporolactobacillus spathodeae]|uniref:Putative competence-damage inducible protein n=1 Tax=Sporolactobacillus spathodeae TaxID=1465502 RepID=A0ABS2Q5Q7_9BACL|nr:competence/damage-inducible protein A [Sporolactobacillus spathodeae]MBM7657016.1 nicotinamide-nucleotide amidase [Sporolactobacillus spathodeae]
MNAEIIAVGSELLLGQIANTNAQFISEQLALLGVNVYFHTVCGDNEGRLLEAVRHAESRADLLIFTGGLGPTRDDLTKETVAHALNRQLITDQQAMDSILDFFQKTGRVMTENNKKQALVIENSTVLPNRHGMAPGMIAEENGRLYLLMPGVPSEMKPMFLDFARGYLTRRNNEHIQSRVLRFFGIGESMLETKLLDLIDAQSNPTIAPLAKESEVTLRLTAKHPQKEMAIQMLDQAEEKIKIRVGSYLYGYNEESLPEVVFRLLTAKKQTIAFAESLTGGMAADWLTAFPGASAVLKGGIVCYTNEVKAAVLGVPEPILNEEGAVSASCAQQMARLVREKCGTSIGVSFTGVAGPDKSEGKEVGTVFIGISDKQQTKSFRFSFSGTRSKIRIQSAKTGYDLVRRQLSDLPLHVKD